MAILFLLIICLMMTVGTFLITSIEETYANSFISDMARFEVELNNSNVLSSNVVSEDEAYKDELFKVFKTYYQIDGTTKKGYLLSDTGKIILPRDKALLNEVIEVTNNIILAESGKIGNLSLEGEYFDYAKPVVIGSNVWIGGSVCVMPGVTIGDGAIVGSRSVVTKDVEPYTIVAGSPAKVIRKRFDDETIAKLLEVKWWDLPDEEVEKLLPDMIAGNLEVFIEKAQKAKEECI